jgi:hypothetical protein
VTRLYGAWNAHKNLAAHPYICAHCDRQVASDFGLTYQERGQAVSDRILVRVCTYCNQPTYFVNGTQFPGPAFGARVESLPGNVAALYEETRQCTSAGASTAAVLVCRKILMHIAVDRGARAGLNFMDYVGYLADNGFVPPDGKGWVDHIRRKGNEANHEIVLMTPQDAQELVSFAEMLLKFIYEFPNRIPKPAPPTTATA